jgi:hypothetical protein
MLTALEVIELIPFNDGSTRESYKKNNWLKKIKK